MWRKSVKKLVGLSPRCHSAFLPFLIDEVPVRYTLLVRVICFMKNCFVSDNPVVKDLALLTVRGSKSKLSNNICKACEISKLNWEQFMKMSKAEIVRCFKSSFIKNTYLSENDIQNLMSAIDFLYAQAANSYDTCMLDIVNYFVQL